MAEGDKQVAVNKATDFDPLTSQMPGAFLARRRSTGMIRYYTSPTRRGWFKMPNHRSCSGTTLCVTGERKQGLSNCWREQKWARRRSSWDEDNMGQRCDQEWHDRGHATLTSSVTVRQEMSCCLWCAQSIQKLFLLFVLFYLFISCQCDSATLITPI